MVINTSKINDAKKRKLFKLISFIKKGTSDINRSITISSPNNHGN